MVWCGVVWCTVWCGVVVLWCGVMLFSGVLVVWCAVMMLCDAVVWCSCDEKCKFFLVIKVWCGGVKAVWCGVMQCGVGWYGMVFLR